MLLLPVLEKAVPSLPLLPVLLESSLNLVFFPENSLESDFSLQQKSYILTEFIVISVKHFPHISKILFTIIKEDHKYTVLAL